MYAHNKRLLAAQLQEAGLDEVECHTVDSFQGREGEVIVLVLCTDALFIVGDISTMDQVDVDVKEKVEGDDGETMNTKGTAIKGMLDWFRGHGRVVNMDNPGNAVDKPAEPAEPAEPADNADNADNAGECFAFQGFFDEAGFGPE
ncbi:hypothetical protein TPAR_03825 [Tolypocladium paradoxum]|uniref:DNA2/NAM7 helicase-like C-terminal domain-containing protein n=1 Tax=Tolypocladium paradoxum TaxID=94208 RepID=A0A2S4L0N2_9HYPO|nr:hypothetical protein TPAR_03825 [Tolypocladium paradoxum]